MLNKQKTLQKIFMGDEIKNFKFFNFVHEHITLIQLNSINLNNKTLM